MSTKKGPPSIAEGSPIPEPLLSRLIVAPVLFVSFLISLVLIDRQTYGTVFGKSGSKDGYYHSHQKKLARREMDDAFQMRSKVIAVMVLVVAVTLALFAWTVESIWQVWRGGTSLP
ncbi:hypothetical protein A1O7_01454 [Cladophialophora yegresii CBS 114405]|uniref:Uncharacterized protein n=1 Tax=Cladophialophora yegresii CBS 114405 TaxID=1182544 RepID=W9X3P9_9EURO|nr:uncharacterized protein A1O7_01454 [Cladophialophora yegresii CBS 114405]EXJ65114.1 hypothetical protein A1O7_01454 [Cladophialophora yegresii CBS 114405]